MKLKSLLTVLFFVPFVAMGQGKVNEVKKAVEKNDTLEISALDLQTRATSRATGDAVVFYNLGATYFGAKEGAIVVSGNLGEDAIKTSNVVIYVEGSMETLRMESKYNTTNPKESGFVMKMADNSVLALTGNMKNIEILSDGGVGSGSVWFLGNGVLGDAGSFSLYQVDNTIPGNPTHKTIDLTSYKAKQRILEYNRLPNIVVDINAYVSLESNVGAWDLGEAPASAAVLELGDVYAATSTFGKVAVRAGSLFAVKTAYSRNTGDGGTDPTIPIDPADPTGTSFRKMHIPSLLMATDMEIGDDATLGRGEVLYDLELYSLADGDLTTNVGTAGSNIPTSELLGAKTAGLIEIPGMTNLGTPKNLTPFVSPYKGLGGDHMFFNLLAKPSGLNLGGEQTKPTDIFAGGQAYFVGLNVSDHDAADISQGWGANVADRAVGGYQFNRKLAMNWEIIAGGPVIKPGFNKHPDSIYDKEIFATVNDADKYVYRLVKGVNFLANPYMGMFDYKDLINYDEADPTRNHIDLASTDWEPAGGTAPVVVDNLDDYQTGGGTGASRAIRSKVYFPTNGAIQFFEVGIPLYYYHVMYLNDQKAGGTWYFDDGVMPPLTVFAIQSNGSSVLKMPKTNIVDAPYALYDENGNITVAPTLPMTPRTARSAEGKGIVRYDEILLEASVYNLDETRSAGVSTTPSSTDRLSFVLRKNASFAFNSSISVDDYIDAQKIYSRFDASKTYRYDIDAASDGFLNMARGVPGSLYTVSSNEYALATNAIPVTAKQVPVYFTPTTTRSKVVIKPYRMETLESVSRAWLEDRYENNLVELTKDSEYEFISDPLATEFSKDNRFILHFNYSPEGEGIVEEEASILCYYKGSTLFIERLLDEDLNSRVEIYDLQGRLAGKTTIKDVPNQTYMHPLAYGVYIVKITGERNHKAKLMVAP